MSEQQHIREVQPFWQAQGIKSFCKAKGDWLKFDRVHLSFVSHAGKPSCKQIVAIEGALKIHGKDGALFLSDMVLSGAAKKLADNSRAQVEQGEYAKAIFESMGGTSAARSKEGKCMFRSFSLVPGMKSDYVIQMTTCDGVENATGGIQAISGAKRDTIRVALSAGELFDFARSVQIEYTAFRTSLMNEARATQRGLIRPHMARPRMPRLRNRLLQRKILVYRDVYMLFLTVRTLSIPVCRLLPPPIRLLLLFNPPQKLYFKTKNVLSQNRKVIVMLLHSAKKTRKVASSLYTLARPIRRQDALWPFPLLIFNDASYENGMTGIACVAYDDSGEILAVRMKTRTADDIVVAELLALQEGAAIAAEISKNPPVVLVSDNRAAVQFLNGEIRIPRAYLSLVKNIKKTLGAKVCWKSRKDNSLADALAILALRRATIENKDTPGVIQFGV